MAYNHLMDTSNSGIRPRSSSKQQYRTYGYDQQLTTGSSQWNAAFGTPASSTKSHPSPPVQRNQAGNFDVRSHPEGMTPQYNAAAPQAGYTPPDGNMPMQANIPAQQPASYSPAQTNSYVTPSMWQQVVANSLVDGRKRQWMDYSGGQGMPMDGVTKRQR